MSYNKIIKIMKAIKIQFEGQVTTRYSVIANEDKFGFCTISDRAFNFIKAHSIDNTVYYTDDSPCDKIFCRNNGEISRYYVKAEVYDEDNLFAPPKEGVWQRQLVEVSIIELYED